jgi:hypothetical protein
MKSLWQRIEDRLSSMVEDIDEWWASAQARLDAVAEAPFRTWLGPFALAMALTVGVVGVLHLLLAATLRAGAVLRWSGTAIAGLLALALLTVVVRSVVISLIEPGQRRLLLLAFLTSAAAVLVGVEAFAAATTALADSGTGLWRVERFYLWQLVDSVPLLDIPRRLEWTEPPVLTNLVGRLLLLGFKLIVIPPLVRVGVALYGFVESHRSQQRYSAAVAIRIRGRETYRRAARPSVFFPLAAGLGVVWIVVDPTDHGSVRILSRTGLVFVGVVLAVVAVVAIAAELLDGVSDRPMVLALAAAAALVWFDSVPRRTLFPGFAGSGLWSKIGVTLLVWLVLLLLMLVFIWDEPGLVETTLALILVLGFLGADAPAGAWLTRHLTWMPWDFPVARALTTAGGWLTVAFLLYLLQKAPRRRSILVDGEMPASGLRQDLRGYLLVGVQFIVAAAAALTLLRTRGLVNVRPTASTGWSSTSESLTAVTWHALDSLPGPDIPGVLGWRLTTDLTGRWAGLVIISTVASIVVFVALPMISTIVLWANLAAARSRSTEPIR